MQKTRLNIDPYRLLFPMGILSVMAGLLLWIFFQKQLVPYYPRQAHANIMFYGFIWSFIAGFLMTAIPRMTGAAAASFLEIVVAIFLVVLQLLVNVRNLTGSSPLLFLFQILFLIVFIARRFSSKGQMPFEGFLFIPFAFLQSILGVCLFLFFKGSRTDVLYLLSGEAFALNLILGLGSRLIPALSRVPNALLPNVRTQVSKRGEFFLLASLFNLGFFVQAFVQLEWGVAIRFLIVLYMAILHLRLFAKGVSLSFVGIGLKLGVICILLSYLGILFQFHLLAAQHLLYIGGFILITLMVATRVMLSHGEQSLDYELKSKRTALIVLLLLLAAIFRFTAGSDIVGSYMLSAAYCALLAVLIWSYKFFKILLSSINTITKD